MLQFREEDFQLRSPEEHKRMCNTIESAGDSAYHSTTFGINYRTPLNELLFFNTCNYGLPPDIMHDLLEGYVPYKIKLMLKVYIEEEHLFSLNELKG